MWLKGLKAVISREPLKCFPVPHEHDLLNIITLIYASERRPMLE